MSNTSKSPEQQAKTDRQLIGAINYELSRGLQLALSAEGWARDADSAEAARLRVERVLDESVILLPAVDNRLERRRLEWKVLQLEQVLNRLSTSVAESSF